VPTIGYAPGVEALAHTNRERLELASARQAFDASPALIRGVQAALAAAKVPVPAGAVTPAARVARWRAFG
jgi:succinyl-diaminopimelate desuccinylase